MATPEVCRKEPDVQLDQDQKNIKNFDNEDRKKDGSILNGFGKMLGNLVDAHKSGDLEQDKKSDKAKIYALADASNILNNQSLPPEEKQKALERIFASFKENKDVSHQNTEQNIQPQGSEKEKSDKFLGDLMSTIGENRADSQKMNANFANKMKNSDIPPAQSGDPRPTNECLAAFSKL